MTAREEYIQGLKMLARTLEDNPDIALPYQGTLATPIVIYFLDGEDPREALAAAAKAIPCSWSKRAFDGERMSYFSLQGSLAGLRVELTAYRDAVCTKVVTGTEQREVEEVETPAVMRKVTREVPVIEWNCSPILADREAATA